MHHKLAKTVAFGGIMALGLGSAQAALAEPAQGTTVPCFTPALYYALGNATDGEVITLAPGCTYYDDDDAEGGAVYNDGTIHLNLGTFSQNTSADGGGAFYNDGDGTASLVYDGISGNGAYQGGGIYNWYGSLTVNLSSITGNTAQDSGGGIYNYDGTVNAYGNYIHDNQPNNCTPDFFGCVN